MKILVRLPNWLGDVVMAVPFLKALRRALPSGEVVGILAASQAPLFAPSKLLDRVIPVPKEKGWLAPWRFGRSLRGERFDVALLLPNSWSSAIWAFAAGIPKRVGYRKDGRSLLLTHALRSIRVGHLRPVPMIEYYLAIARAAGFDTAGIGHDLSLAVSPEAQERTDARLAAAGVGREERTIALSVGANFGPSKRWTPGGWGAVIDHFLAKGRQVILYGGPPDRPVAEEAIAAATRRGAQAITDAPLGDLVAHMRRAELLISTDSGGRHLGYAAGIPVVVVMGPTHPNYSEVEYERTFVHLEKVECWPCHLKVCPIDHRCMTRITPEAVIGTAEELLAGRLPRGGARPWVTRPGEEGRGWRIREG